ncbi:MULTISPECIES: Wzz/FepE/Etk N-terminal domain-containing protein [unclassified Legionella]|uniref:Wzz/FepE/Etk N-terminal domain-containing protein n=1 Tax=unclassified Legionella TaxID=2622702 RepID=UPI00105679E8|nr:MULTISPECIES: Wzz/FepE/Etk N-terminal domain-containing protein [unclassified Legionella]MDI9817769.1 Wzz/FepE/Etk N-terminal domain-containing protein [Legionella sp. PL877]
MFQLLLQYHRADDSGVHMEEQSGTVNRSEIELTQLFRVLWRGKWFIFGVMAFMALLAIFYAHKSKPVYQAKVALIKPIKNDLLSINSVKELAIRTDDVFHIFLGVLFAESTRSNFLNKEKEQDKNNAPISVVVNRDVLNRYNLHVNAYSPVAAKGAAKRFLRFVHDEVQVKLNETFKRELTVLNNKLQGDINFKHALAKREKEAQIALADEKLRLAKALYIKNKNDSDLYIQQRISELSAEIDNIQNRADDIFVPQLRELEEKSLKLKNYQPDFTNVIFARVDDRMVVSETYMRQKSKVFVALSILVGFLIGCILITVWNFKSLLISK